MRPFFLVMMNHIVGAENLQFHYHGEYQDSASDPPDDDVGTSRFAIPQDLRACCSFKARSDPFICGL
jgi:hypothetical protein